MGYEGREREGERERETEEGRNALISLWPSLEVKLVGIYWICLGGVFQTGIVMPTH